MFVYQKELTSLDLPSSQVLALYRSGSDVRLVLTGEKQQPVRAYLALLNSSTRLQVVLIFHLTETKHQHFYLSDAGHLSVENADREFQAGLEFAERMGFILFDCGLRKMPENKREAFWRDLPFCSSSTPGTAEQCADLPQPSAPIAPTPAAPPASDSLTGVQLGVKRQLLREQLGRFLASL